MEQCIYVRFNQSEYILLAVHMDELIFAGVTHQTIREFKQQIARKYKFKDFGKFDKIISMEGSLTHL